MSDVLDNLMNHPVVPPPSCEAHSEHRPLCLVCCVAGVGPIFVEGTDGSSARLGVKGGQVAGGVGLREVPVWSALNV